MKLLENMKMFFEKREKQLIGLLAIVATCVFCYQLGRESLWLDETYTYYASDTWDSLVATIGWKEKNMWLYHSMMYFWKFLGPGEFVMRLLSVVFGVLGVVYMYKMGKEISGKMVGFTSAILLILNTFYLRYAQEARGYSLFSFLFIISSYYLIRLIKDNSPRNRLLYIVFTGISIYSQVFALLFIGLQALYLLWLFKNSWKHFFSFVRLYLGVSLFIVPLVLAYIFSNTKTVVTRTQNVLNWVSPSTWDNLFDQYYMYSSESITLFFLYFALIVFLAGLILFGKEKKLQKEFLYIGGMAFIPVLFIFLFSMYIKPIFIPRYLVFTLPAFIMLVAMGLNSIRYRYVMYGLFILLILLNVKSLAGYYATYKKEQWRQAIQYIYDNKKAGEKIVIFPYYLRLPFGYYAPSNPKYNSSNVIISFPNDIKDYSAETVDQNIASLSAQVAGAPGVWVLSRKDNRPEIRTIQKNRIDRLFEDAFGKKQDMDQFVAVDVDYYSR